MRIRNPGQELAALLLRQTVDKRSGLTIRRDLFPAGLHIVFIVKPDDVDCQQKTVIREGWNPRRYDTVPILAFYLELRGCAQSVQNVVIHIKNLPVKGLCGRCLSV
jgi:hypothetical protein